jgi:hypothetical protein
MISRRSFVCALTATAAAPLVPRRAGAADITPS